MDRFRVLDGEARKGFRELLGAYVRLYAFLSQIMPWRDEAVPLSQLVDLLNERFGATFTPADQLFLDQVTEQARRIYEEARGEVASGD